jgi:ribosomal protein S18 acetylase RimI-like enzyme
MHSWQWRARPFDDSQNDLVHLRQFVDDCWKASDGVLWDMHPGDLIWQRFMHEDHIGRWPERVRIWETDDGGIAGFTTIHETARELIICLHPELGADRRIVGDMVAQAEAHLSMRGIEGPLSVSAFADGLEAEALTELHYVQTGGPAMRLNRRTLDEIPSVALPDGFLVRPLTGEHEFEERVSVHQEAFRPSRVTVAAYRRLRQAPGYDPELDLVCVAPDGTFASYCIAWLDPATRLGEFEPVGARAAYRRMGLTRAVMTAGMRRLRERGATAALVSCFDDNPAACGLYESLGFREARRWVPFGRTGSSPGG